MRAHESLLAHLKPNNDILIDGRLLSSSLEEMKVSTTIIFKMTIQC